MESIDALRREVCRNGSDRTVSLVADQIGKIEQEIKERYIELPKDANGEPITYDTMTEQWGALDSIWCMMEADGSCVWYVRGHDISAPIVEASEVTVVKPPTVEDILRVFADRVRNEAMKFERVSDDTIAEYAAKLQLREAE